MDIGGNWANAQVAKALLNDTKVIEQGAKDILLGQLRTPLLMHSDGRNRATVTTESLARVIASKTQKLVLICPSCVAPRFEALRFGVHSCNIRSTWICGMACES